MAHYTATQPIMGLYLEAEKCPGEKVQKWWWEQEVLSLEGARESTEVIGVGEEYG